MWPEPADPVRGLRIAIAAVKAAPQDPETRAALGSMIDQRALREPLAMLLADEARAAERPEVAAALFEHLVDLYEEQDQPLDAITAMEAVVANAPDVAELHDRLAWMYRRAGAWAKAAVAFEEVGSLAAGERGRAALRAAGRLYREHKQLDRAVHVFRAIIARQESRFVGESRFIGTRQESRFVGSRQESRFVGESRSPGGRRPGDDQTWRELDEVLSELGRWREVAEVRAARAENACGVERAALMRAQARALEQAGEIGAAADAVVAAAIHAPDDLSGLIDHADVLVRGGKHGEAAELLRARLGEAVDRDAPSDQIAAIRLRLVGALDDAGDRGAATTEIEDLLVEAPDYLPALERAAAFAAIDPDPRIHATALLRYASALPEADVALVVAAARRFRDAGDHEAAVRAFENAVEIGGDDDVEDELEDARASLIAERARIAALAGDVAGAERRLRAILANRFSKEAHLALVDVLCGAGRLEDAAEHLRETLNRLEAPPAVLAPLVHRHAMVRHALGDLDDAHRLLHEAHRLDRRDLAITLALGESCFQRRLWREAARHLSSLVDHPDIHRHHRAVAVGLVHAALAETRSLRPANAPGHLDAAVRIDPACGSAWHALAEAAVERGDLLRAAECLEREAAATIAPSERVRLYDALGDMARDVLGEPARAERCWIEIRDLCDASVLDKLLALQRKFGAPLERARTCLRLAEQDAGASKALREEAATLLAAGGESERARQLVEELIASHPVDLDTLACASEVAAGDAPVVARWLRRALVALDQRTRGAEHAPRMAALWRTLGDAERTLGDLHAARTAYRKATVAAPASDGALAARRGLVELSSDETSATAPVALQSSLFALVEAELDASDALSLARELRATNPEDARATYELARVLGAPLSDDDETFYARRAPRALASDEAYAIRLDDAQRRALIDDPDDGPLAEVFELLGEIAPLIISDTRAALLDADLADAQRVAVTGKAAAAAILPPITKALGGPTTALFASTRATETTLLLAAPPAIVIGTRANRVSPGLDVAADTALRFELGRLVELARWRRVFAGGARRDDFVGFVAALAALVPGAPATPPAAGEPPPNPPAAGGPPPTMTARRDADQLRAKLPVAYRARLVERLAALPYIPDADAYLAACRRAADRAGLLACGDLTVAVALAGGAEAAPHLVQFAATRQYLTIRRALRHRDTEDRTAPFART